MTARAAAAIAIALGGAGCDLVFGLDGRSDAATEGAVVHVSGRFSRPFVANADDGTPVLGHGVLDADDAPTVTAEGVPLAVSWDPAAGTFAFDTRPDTPYEVQVGAVIYESSAAELAIDDPLPGRLDAEPATTTTLHVTLTPAPTTELVRIDSTGVYTQTNLTHSNGQGTVIWAMGGGYGLVPRLLDATRGDRIYALQYTPANGGVPVVIARYAEQSVTLGPGDQDLPFTTVAATPNTCAMLAPTAATELARVAAAYPGLIANTGGWELDATPAPALAVGVSITLQIAYRYAGTGIDEPSTVMVGNPFPGTTVLALQAVNAYRPVGAHNVFTGTSYATILEAGCPAIAFPSGVAALPMRAVLANVPLAQDGVTIGLAAATPYATLAWTAQGPTAADIHSAELFEVTAAPPMVLRARLFSAEPSLRIPTRLFEPGKLYIIRMQARSGRPGVASGDFTQRTYPTWNAAAYSSTFFVVQ